MEAALAAVEQHWTCHRHLLALWAVEALAVEVVLGGVEQHWTGQHHR